MAKREKRVTSLTTEDGLEAEASLVPTHSRRSQVLGSHQKDGNVDSRKFRPRLPASNGSPPEPLPAREPAGPVPVRAKHSPANSPEHWQRLDRVPQLRAPYRPQPAQPVPPVRAPRPTAAKPRRPALRAGKRA
jgi:hypothetical protein